MQSQEHIARMLEADQAARDRPRLLAALSSYSRSIVQAARCAPPVIIDTNTVNRTLEWLRRPVFVCGHHRSGTTLLQELLDDHPQLLVIPVEATYFASFPELAAARATPRLLDAFVAEWISRLIDPNGKRHFHLGRASVARNPPLEFARSLLAWYGLLAKQPDVPAGLGPLWALAAAYRDTVAPEQTPRCWVEKTPLNECHVRRLARLPEARFIQLVRDPAATLRSQLADLRAAAVPDVEAAEQAWRIGRSLRLALRNPRAARGRYLVLRYEDLVSTTEREMTRVRQFLAIDPNATLQTPTVLGQAVASNSAFERSQRGAIRAATEAQPLDATQSALIAAFARPAARQLGYQTGSAAALKLAAMRTWQRLLLAPRFMRQRARRTIRIPRT